MDECGIMNNQATQHNVSLWTKTEAEKFIAGYTYNYQLIIFTKSLLNLVLSYTEVTKTLIRSKIFNILFAKMYIDALMAGN